MPPLSILRTGALAALLVVSACGDTTAPFDDANVAPSDFPRAATGGDPRGTYALNAPPVQLLDLPAGVSVSFTRNTGSGRLSFNGTSATEGTYSANALRLEVFGTITAPGQSASFEIGGGTAEGPLARLDGSWRVIGAGQIELSAPGETPDTLGYAVTDGGLFLVEASPLLEGRTSLAVLAFKRWIDW